MNEPEMPELAFVIIASEKRRTTTFERVLESVRGQEYGEVVVVADFPVEAKGVRSYLVTPITRTTIDALVKRDVGTCATTAPNICYLCDDHVLAPAFAHNFLTTYLDRDWSVLAPSRFAERDGTRIPLNTGETCGWAKSPYAGGHCAIYRRYWVTRVLPWSAGPHHRNWDLLHSAALRALGATITYAGTDLAVEDIEGVRPWDPTYA